MAESKPRTAAPKPPTCDRTRAPSLVRSGIELASAVTDFIPIMMRWLHAKWSPQQAAPGPGVSRLDGGKELEVSGIRNPEVAHEEDDINFRLIAGFGIGLIIAGAITFLALRWEFNFLAARAERSRLPPPPLASEQSKLPPEPRLQGTPGHSIQPLEDLQQLRAAEDAVLNSYGWVDPSGGVVRIPIDRAMELLAERGLPTRPQNSEQTVDQGIIAAPEISSSGRILEKVQ